MTLLRLGSTGEAVTCLQEKLKAAGFSPGAIDGDFGPGTQAAVLAFQHSRGLLADGIAGPRTLAALEAGDAAAPPDPVALPSVMDQVTASAVARMFPFTQIDNIKENLPFVRDALTAAGLADKPMVLVALATIRAETESFQPISEGRSRFNTSPGGHPFDLYDGRTDLGNQGPPDGERFRGRGYIQLTGRDNYRRHGAAIGLGDRLVEQSELANDPATAARLLASFLGAKERRIKEAVLDDDLRAVRRLVNGGSHGLDRFTEAYRVGEGLIA